MLIRKANWDTGAFHDFLLQRFPMPFAWGVNDCALMAADAVQAITGTDIAPEFRNRYADRRGATELIRSLTGGTTVAHAAAHCARRFGMPEWKHPLQAQRGDLVIVKDAHHLVAGVVHLNGTDAVVVGQDGLKRLPLSAVRKAWHV